MCYSEATVTAHTDIFSPKKCEIIISKDKGGGFKGLYWQRWNII